MFSGCQGAVRGVSGRCEELFRVGRVNPTKTSTELQPKFFKFDCNPATAPQQPRTFFYTRCMYQHSIRNTSQLFVIVPLNHGEHPRIVAWWLVWRGWS